MKVKLLEPIEGYEEIAEYRSPKMGEDYLIENHYSAIRAPVDLIKEKLILTPKRKVYNWDKTAEYVLCYSAENPTSYNFSREIISYSDPVLVEDHWYPHFGGPCPFDPKASIVEVLGRSKNKEQGVAEEFEWGHDEHQRSDIIAVRFLGLAEGYSWS